jgi:glycosyltransferase involved in cell wall biosynthesis
MKYEIGSRMKRDVGRILINGSFFHQEISGQQRFAREMTKEISKIVNDEERFKVLKPSKYVGRSPVLAWLWTQFLPLRAGRGDVIISFTSRAPIWWASKCVMTIHDLFPISHPEWYSKSYARLSKFRLSIILKANLRLCATVSEPVQITLRELGIRSQIVLTPNGVGSEFNSVHDEHESQKCLESFGLETKSFFLVANPDDPRKNVEYFLESLEILERDTGKSLEVVSTGNPSKSIFANLNFTPRIRRLGQISDRELSILYTNSIALIFPSLDEGFGIPIIEAVASGGKVLASDIEVHRWLGLEAKDLIPLGESIEFAKTLKNCFTIEGSKPTRLVKDFSWNQSAQTLVTELLGNR